MSFRALPEVAPSLRYVIPSAAVCHSERSRLSFRAQRGISTVAAATGRHRTAWLSRRPRCLGRWRSARYDRAPIYRRYALAIAIRLATGGCE
jgi:hypothetical protein